MSSTFFLKIENEKWTACSFSQFLKKIEKWKPEFNFHFFAELKKGEMKNESLCSIFIFLKIEKWQMKICIKFSFFNENKCENSIDKFSNLTFPPRLYRQEQLSADNCASYTF